MLRNGHGVRDRTCQTRGQGNENRYILLLYEKEKCMYIEGINKEYKNNKRKQHRKI